MFVANSRSRAFRKSISAQGETLYEYALGGFELTKLTYTRLEDITRYATGAVSDIEPVAPVVYSGVTLEYYYTTNTSVGP